jgi:type I restriction enzyme S subunit
LNWGSGDKTQAGMSTTFSFDASHVLYGKLRPYLNKVALPESEGRCSTEIIPLVPSEGIDRGFLAYLLRLDTITAAVMKGVTGARMPRANMRELLAVSVPVPPIREQWRITRTLRERFAELDRARKALADQLDAAEKYSTALLREAFEELRGSHVPVVRLDEVSRITSGLTLGRTLRGPSRNVHYLRVANVKAGYLDLSGVNQTMATADEIAATLLEQGDLLLTEGGDPDKLGRGTLWRGQLPECSHQNHIFRVRFDSSKVDPEFAALETGSPYGRAYFFAHAKQTTGIASINKTVLSAFPFLLPNLATQKRIAKEINGRMDVARALRASLAAQLTALDRYPAALLRDAFAGRL